tara:strand:+ start:1698 stop:2507 length:810 start_codon:yes stop_codon:yes gene_type:complete
MRTLLCSALIGLFLAPVVHGNPLADGIATATGLGTADPGMARNRVHGKMLARRAAVADAQRALLEVVQGVRITSGTTVKDAQLESDVIANRVKGLLRNYFTLSENLTEEEGTWQAEVTLGICVSRTAPPCKNSPTINEAVFDQLKRTVPSGLYRSSATPETSFSGLVVDLTESDFVPLLDARLVDGSGKELYGPGHYKGRGGDWLHWARSVEQAERNHEVVGSTPLVVKATTSPGEPGIALGDADAEQVFAADAGSQFLAEGRVILVTN